MTVTFDKVLDTSGLRCPEPVMMLHNEIRRSKVGETLKVVATDPSTERDIPRFCQFLGHELLSMSEQQGLYCYVIRKA